MEEDAIHKLEEQLKCSICLQIYEEPKLLQCSHVFCTKCLQEFVSKSYRKVLDRSHVSQPFSLSCPSCREVTSILKSVTELKPSFQTNQFLDVLRDLKGNKISGQSALQSLSSQAAKGSTGATSIAEPVLVFEEPHTKCSEHSNAICNLFCRTCNTLICGSCTVLEHHSHNYSDATVEFEKTKIELSSSLFQLDRVIKNLQDGVSDIASQRSRITDQKSAIEAEIHCKIASLHKVLDDRLLELLSDLNLLTEQKLSSLKAEKDRVNLKLCPLVEFRDNMKESICTSSRHKLLKEKKIISKSLQQKLSLCQSVETVSVETKVDMTFSCSPYVSDNCRNYGNVYAPDRPHPYKCRAEGEGLEKAVVGVPTAVDLTVLDYCGEICNKMVIENLECKLEAVGSGSFISSAVENLGCGRFRMTYVPVARGEHLLHIKIEQENIKESPFAVKVDCSIEKLGSVEVQSITGLDRPCGLGFTSTGKIVVAEKGGQTVSILLPTGKKFKSFEALPDGGEMARCGIAIDRQSGILLVDTHKHCVRLFSSSGEPIVFDV